MYIEYFFFFLAKREAVYHSARILKVVLNYDLTLSAIGYWLPQVISLNLYSGIALGRYLLKYIPPP